MDEFGVIDRLIFNRETAANVEPLAVLLGMVHLYRASGVHLLGFFSFLKFVTNAVFKALGLKPERADFVSLILTGISIFWIWKFQDFRISLIRPIFTFLIRCFFKNRGAKARVLIPLLLTFIFETLLSRQTSLSDGALHYYLSVAGGLIAYDLCQTEGTLKRHLAMSIGSWIPIAIISLSRDHLVSYLTPIYSLISLPIISFFLYPLTLIDLGLNGSVSTGTVFCWNHFLEFLFRIPDFGPSFSSVSGRAVWVTLPLAISLSFFWKKIAKNQIVLAFTLFMLIASRDSFAKLAQKSEVVQLDVHQGDSCMIKDRSHRTEMVDVGSLKIYAPDLWIEKLSKNNVQNVDGILLSHLDEDHVGALKELLLLMPVSCVETNGELWKSKRGQLLSSWIQNNAPKTEVKSQGCVVLPRVNWFKSSRITGNEIMGGLVYAPNDHEAYFALGDGDEEQELQYEKFFKNEIEKHPVRIWKISHHGSRFSSNFGFLTRLAPEAFWISVGRHNPYHHPSVVTLQKLSELPGTIYRTDVDGDISRSFSE
jgi:competence protein ComEC